MIVEEFPDRIVSIKGRTFLYFGGTSYLGMGTNKGFKDLIIEGIKKWGTFYGSSRNANIQLSIYETAEKLLAKWMCIKTTVTVSSGALAGKLVLDYLSKSIDAFYHYPKTHPAIIKENSLPLFLNGKLHPNLTNATNESIAISVDAMLALEVNATSFHFLDTIPLHKIITLVVDESHTIGLLGASGRGIFADISVKRLKQKIVVASMGKALGLSGGLIGGESELIHAIKTEATFVSSSGANPAYLYAFSNGQSIYKTQRATLKSNMLFLFKLLKPDITESHNKAYPVLYFQKEGFYKTLLDQGIIITSFEYPSYDFPMHRVVITANHTKEDLKLLALVLNNMA